MITACEKLADTLRQVECQMCDSGSVHVFLWNCALRIERGGLYTVKIPDGEHRDMDCLCRDCGCEWGEVAYPVGSEVFKENKVWIEPSVKML